MTEPSPVSTAGQPPAEGAGGSPARSRLRDVVVDLTIVLGGMVLLGVLCGVLWWLLVDPPAFTKLRDGGVMREHDLSRQFSADGVYVVVATVAGLVGGLLLTWWRSRDVLLTSVLLVVGAVLAAATMELTGQLLGPGDPGSTLAAVEVGSQVPEPLDVGVAGGLRQGDGLDAFSVYLAWPISVLAGALVVLLNATPSEPSDSNQ